MRPSRRCGGSWPTAPSAEAGRPARATATTRRSIAKPEATAWVQVDLGRSVPIDEVRLVPARPVDFPDTPGFGFPHRFRVEVSDDPGFTPGRTTRSSTSGPTAEPPGTSRTSSAAAGGRAVRPRHGHPAVEAHRRLRLRARRAGGDRRAASNVAAGRVGDRVSTRSRAACGAARAWSTASTAGAPGPRSADPAAARRHATPGTHPGAGRARRRLADDRIDPTLRDDREAARGEIAGLDARIKALPPGEMVYSVLSHAPRPIAVLRRGEVEQPGEPVGPGSLSCVPGLDPIFSVSESDDEGARRAALAEWIASPANLLTWRSIVNRVWHYHFGRGLVDTPNDFGRNGSKPTHPELLDWLAVELRDGGQSLKALHRLIVTSAVYRQSSRDDAASPRRRRQPLLWRMNRQRLDAEELRDSVLAVSGKLDPRWAGRASSCSGSRTTTRRSTTTRRPASSTTPATRRRTVYRFVVRSVPNPFLECLDGADPNINTPVRSTRRSRRSRRWPCSTTPSWSSSREHFADRLRDDRPTTPRGRSRPRSSSRWAGRPGGRARRRGRLRPQARPGQRLPGAVQHQRVPLHRLILSRVRAWAPTGAGRLDGQSAHESRVSRSPTIPLAAGRRPGRRRPGPPAGRRGPARRRRGASASAPEWNGGLHHPAQGAAGRAAVHVGRRQPVRHVRLQAAADQEARARSSTRAARSSCSRASRAP